MPTSQTEVAELIGSIIQKYHEPLRKELPLVEQLAERVAQVHGGEDPRLQGLYAAVQALSDALRVHLDEEERDIFPAMTAPTPPPTLAALITSMTDEHVIVRELFQRMRYLTDGFTLPASACNTYRRLFDALTALERDIDEHIVVEDQQLAPRFTAR